MVQLRYGGGDVNGHLAYSKFQRHKETRNALRATADPAITRRCRWPNKNWIPEKVTSVCAIDLQRHKIAR